MVRNLACFWAAGVIFLLLLLLPVVRNVEPSFDIELAKNARAWMVLPDAAPDIWYLIAVAMLSYATVPSIPSSLQAVEWDIFFADASRDFAVHEDIAARCGDFCEQRPLDVVSDDLQFRLSELLTRPALGFIENKLYRHYWTTRMGVPVPDLLYVGTVHPLAADLGLPVYDQTAFVEAAIGSLDKTGFVLKPLMCESGSGVLVMDLERWIAENWTSDSLISYVHVLAGKSSAECSTWTKIFSETLVPPPPYGILLHKRYIATTGGPSCTGTSPPSDTFFTLGFTSNCLPIEFRAWLLFGRLYGVESYTVCGTAMTPFWMYADGRGGWADCGPLSVDPVYHETCALSVDDQRRCRTTLQTHMPEIKRWSEKIAHSTGLDLVRTDWFMGGPDGLQLNEVSYGPMGTFQPARSLEEYLWSRSGHTVDYRFTRVLRLAYAKLGMGSANNNVRILPRATMLKTLGCSETHHADLPIICH